MGINPGKPTGKKIYIYFPSKELENRDISSASQHVLMANVLIKD